MGRYINSNKLNTSNVVKVILYIVGGLTGAVNLFMLMFFFFSFLPDPENRNDMGINFAVGAFFAVNLAVSILMIVIGLGIGKKVKRTQFYASIFESDTDGIVDKQELTDQTGMQIFDVLKELDVLITRSYLRNCALRRGSDPAVLLTVDNAVSGKFVTAAVKCPACGGVVQIRKGTTATCEYCGAVVKG
ncbi:MAG: hypothetical protein J6I96_00530 [Oscillospiraceae bacterium]|nr:hypothetical protein [Oscillospiraceae bacterium]